MFIAAFLLAYLTVNNHLNSGFSIIGAIVCAVIGVFTIVEAYMVKKPWRIVRDILKAMNYFLKDLFDTSGIDWSRTKIKRTKDGDGTSKP